ncbi:N-ethylmaleimide reductase [Lasiodiplodia hormozganensis]|uniref:N-ethylmaleimide reductase n=1 Tax=Lasiodiplodia hormozganensis TaxID=869390 RepID=A0AA40C4Z5_9PEZI|nr:N-ethylmaleimide reductase [Lasiodiplodia hormozganensis]
MLSLLEPAVLGDSLSLRNRICMGAMTRNRCVDDNKPTEATVKHYATRARDGVGLIVAEGTFVYLNGAEWTHTPVMYDKSHAQAWKKVTDAVHSEGGKILFQPWHPGRIQNENMPMLKNTGYPVLAPSRVKAEGGKYRLLEGHPGHTENITEIDDPGAIIEQYRTSVKLAKEAGFDGIELLAQGGYLLHNFLCSHSNKRTDSYGGSVENRCRFVLEVLDAIIDSWGSPRQVGIKICPTDDYNDTTVSYEELSETYDYLIKEIVARKLAFVNLSRRGCDVSRAQDDFFKPEPRPAGKELPPGYEPLQQFGHLVKFPGSATMLMVNHEYTVEEADALVKEGRIDLVGFSRPFICNPVKDLITRIKKGIDFAVNDRGGKVNYGPYETVDEGYNDWPTAIQN